MPHKDTSLAVNKLYIYQSEMTGMIRLGHINTGFQDYSLAVIGSRTKGRITKGRTTKGRMTKARMTKGRTIKR